MLASKQPMRRHVVSKQPIRKITCLQAANEKTESHTVREVSLEIVHLSVYCEQMAEGNRILISAVVLFLFSRLNLYVSKLNDMFIFLHDKMI